MNRLRPIDQIAAGIRKELSLATWSSPSDWLAHTRLPKPITLMDAGQTDDG